MDYIKKNKEVFIIISVMIVFALLAGGYFLLIGKDTDNNNKNNINNGNNDNNDNKWNNNEGFKNDSTVISNHLKCTKFNKDSNIVYTLEECIIEDSTGQSFKIKLPQVNLVGNEITTLNNRLKKDYEDDKRIVEFSRDNEELIQIGLFNYTYYDSNEILSLLIKREEIIFDSHGWAPIYQIYNVNKSTGQLLSNDEVIAFKNINITNSLAAIQGAVKRIYLKEMDYDIEEANGDPIVENYFNSLDRVIINNVFINNNGDLVALVELPIPFWSGDEIYLIEIDNNSASYQKNMPL